MRFRRRAPRREGEQSGERFAPSGQLASRSGLDDPRPVEHDDPVRLPRQIEAMGDYGADGMLVCAGAVGNTNIPVVMSPSSVMVRTRRVTFRAQNEHPAGAALIAPCPSAELDPCPALAPNAPKDCKTHTTKRVLRKYDFRPMSTYAMVWTFVRRHQTVEIRREESPGGRPLLVVIGGDAAGTTEFRDLAALVQQQSRLEEMLLDSGWSLASFEPERRSHADRRAHARDTVDRRRRWWTDPEFRKREER